MDEVDQKHVEFGHFFPLLCSIFGLMNHYVRVNDLLSVYRSSRRYIEGENFSLVELLLFCTSSIGLQNLSD